MKKTKLILLVCSVLLGASAAQATLINHWALDEISGTTVADSVGSLSGTLVGGVAADLSAVGVRNTGIDFAGQGNGGGYIDVGSNPISGNAARAVSLWFNADAIGANQARLVGMGAAAAAQSFDITVENFTGASIGLRYGNGNVGFSGAAELGSAVQTDTWYHLVVQYGGGAINNATTGLQVYLNGVQLARDGGNNNNSTQTLNTTGAALYIGAGPGATIRTFNGTIDEVQFYNAMLTPAEITALGLLDPTAPSITSFEATPVSVTNYGDTVTLSWNVLNADGLSIDPGIGDVTGMSSISTVVNAETTYSLIATNAVGSATSLVSVAKVLLPPSIQSFIATPSSVTNYGDTVTLSWQVANADTLSIDQGIGDVTGLVSTQIVVGAATTYALMATNADGADAASVRVSMPASQPNIVLFLVDDMGANDTSEPFLVDGAGNDLPTLHNGIYRTPNMETLAAQGMKFTRAYAMPVCTPTRNCLMNGQNSVRHHVTNWTNTTGGETGQNSTISHNSPLYWRRTGFDNSIIALPEILSDAGYRSIHVGKGHFGNTSDNADPLDIGFDVNIGGKETGHPGSYYGTANFGSDSYQVPHLEAYHGQDIFLTEALTLEMNKAIEDSVTNGAPFFAYMSHYAVHGPFNEDSRFAGNYPTLSGDTRAFATLIEGMDKSLGDMIVKLNALGVAEDTLIIFVSDNGSTRPPLSGYPLRGYKGQKYEGGIRVPMIVAWAKNNPANTLQQALPIPMDSYEDDIVACFDLFPTILGVANVSHGNLIDGYDLSSYFAGVPGSHRPQDLLIHFPHDHNGADGDYYTIYHEGDFKLIYNFASDTYELYNIVTDIAETINLAGTNPDQVMAMARKMAIALNDHGAQWPTFDSSPDYDDPFAMPVLAGVDLDEDGLDDNTEDPNYNGLVDAGETNPDNDNTDGDGTIDGAEVRTGTDPLDPASDFIGAWVHDGAGDFTATWPSAPGAFYEIQTTDDLTEWAGPPIVTAIPANGSGTNTSYVIPPSTDPQRFYRIGLLP